MKEWPLIKAIGVLGDSLFSSHLSKNKIGKSVYYVNKDQFELFLIIVVFHCNYSRVTKAKKPAGRLPGASPGRENSNFDLLRFAVMRMCFQAFP